MKLNLMLFRPIVIDIFFILFFLFWVHLTKNVSFVISKDILLLMNWMLSGHCAYKWITECCSEV